MYAKRHHNARPTSHHDTLPIIEEPFSRIAMDIVRPLPRSRIGNRYVLVICDYATRYPEAVPLKSIDAEHVVEELVMLFSRVGIPREILTDQGSSSHRNYSRRFINCSTSTLYGLHPITPRQMVWSRGSTRPSNACYRRQPYRKAKTGTSCCASTGFSPFELVYGRAIRGPLDVIREQWVASKKCDESVISHVLSIRDKLSKMTESKRTWRMRNRPRKDGTTRTPENENSRPMIKS